MQLLNRLIAQIASSVAFTLIAVLPAHAQNVTTVAGNDGLGGFAGDGGLATDPAVRLSGPAAVLTRADGSVLIAEQSGNRVRKVDVGGIITTFAGTGVALWSGDGGQATAAQINSPASLATDASGNVYIGSVGAIRKVSPTGIISTVAGTGTSGDSGIDGSPANAAQINRVDGLALDAAGNLFFTDLFRGRVRKVDTAGNIFNIAGTGTNGAFVADGVPAVGAVLDLPAGILVEADGSLIVIVGGQHRVRKIIPGGNITTIAGTGTASTSGDGGQAIAATLNVPRGLTRDGAGGFIVGEQSGQRVRKIAADGIITTLIGNGTIANSGDGGLATAASIATPRGVSLDTAGNLFITSFFNHIVRKIAAPPIPIPGPSVFNAYVNTATANLGTISPAGEQTVPFGGVVNVTVTANPRHILRVVSNCDYVQTSHPIALVPIGTGVNTYAVTVNGPCQMEATFTPLIPKVNVNSEMAANALFMATERSFKYITPTTISQTSSAVGQAVTFKAWVTDIAGVPYPSATNVITFKNNGVAIEGCSNVPLTLRNSNVIHIREANCTTTFTAAGNSVITTEFAGDTYNFPAASSGLNHSVSVAP